MPFTDTAGQQGERAAVLTCLIHSFFRLRQRIVGCCDTLEPAYMVQEYKVFGHIRSILGWSQSVIAVLPYDSLMRSAQLCGQFFLDKTWSL